MQSMGTTFLFKNDLYATRVTMATRYTSNFALFNYTFSFSPFPLPLIYEIVNQLARFESLNYTSVICVRYR